MLEVKYVKDTGAIIAWAASPEHQGGHFEPEEGEEVAVIDIPTPENSDTYLFDEASQTLIDNPNYTEPEPVRDPLIEIDKLKERLDKLEKK